MLKCQRRHFLENRATRFSASPLAQPKTSSPWVTIKEHPNRTPVRGHVRDNWNTHTVFVYDMSLDHPTVGVALVDEQVLTDCVP